MISSQLLYHVSLLVGMRPSLVSESIWSNLWGPVIPYKLLQKPIESISSGVFFIIKYLPWLPNGYVPRIPEFGTMNYIRHINLKIDSHHRNFGNKQIQRSVSVERITSGASFSCDVLNSPWGRPSAGSVDQGPVPGRWKEKEAEIWKMNQQEIMIWFIKT